MPAASGSVTDQPEFAPPLGPAEGPLGVVQAADRDIARLTAVKARAVAAFAATRPASADRPQGTRGAMSPKRWAARPEVLSEVSEWAAPEVSVALSITQPAAEALLARSLTLVERLPGTLRALEAGALHAGHLWPLLEHVSPIAEDRVRGEVETSLLRWCAGRVTTPAQLGQKARREVLRRDARAQARGLEQAIRERGVSLKGESTAGMAGVLAVVTEPEAQALYAALGAYADAIPDDPGHPRTRGQKMADCLMDLVLRPGESELPPVQVLLTVVASVATALGGDQPGEVNGRVVPAETVRALLHGLADAPAESASATTDGPEELSVPERLALQRYWDEMELAAGAEAPPGPVLQPLPDAGVTGAVAARRTGEPPGLPRDPLPASSAPDPAAGAGWWAAADRAVRDAGRVMFQVQQALGHAERLVATAERADAADEAAWRASPPGRVDAAAEALGALAAAAGAERAALADLLRRSGGGGLADRPRLALTDATTGALVALTDLPGLRAAAHCGRRVCRRRPQTCRHPLAGRPGLGPPGPTHAYRPAAALDRFVRARDRRCRFPGCRRRVPRAGELDHDRPWPDGPTSTANLAGYCTSDHRGKHQAPGWSSRLAADGTLTVTTPTGLTAVTAPPPY
jgi:hypothetical protein